MEIGNLESGVLIISVLVGTKISNSDGSNYAYIGLLIPPNTSASSACAMSP